MLDDSESSVGSREGVIKKKDRLVGLRFYLG